MIPKNRQITGKYTDSSGVGDNIILRYEISRKDYKGYYNIINGNKYYSGKEYNNQSKPLILVETPQKNTSIPLNSGIVSEDIRYFQKNLHYSDIRIKEIDKTTYDTLNKSPNSDYQIISYNRNVDSLDVLDKKMKGLKSFLNP